MRAQDYLEQLDKLNAMIQNKIIEKEQWQDIAKSSTSGGKSVMIEVNGKLELHNMDRVQSSGNPEKMTDAICRYIEIEKEIDALVYKLVDKKMEIIRTIEQLKSATEYKVIHARYIQGNTYDEIGDMFGKSRSWATTVHGRALQSLQKILDRKL